MAQRGAPERRRLWTRASARGAFARDLGCHGVAIAPIGLQSPEQIGAVERHGDLWKAIAKRVISSKRLVGEEQVKRLTPEITMVKNDQS